MPRSFHPQPQECGDVKGSDSCLLLPALRGDRHDYLANHASGVVVEADFAIQILGQPAFYQSRPETLAARRGHHRASAFLPEQPHSLALLEWFDLPSNVDVPNSVV